MNRRLVVEADGGSRGNPGPAAYGAVVREAATGEVLVELADHLGHTTNNVAEYTAALECVRAWIELRAGLGADARLELRGDSKLVVEQMCGRWQVKQGAYVVVYRELRALLDAHAIAVTWTWIPRAENARADELSKQELVNAGVKIVH